jgi:hypothetical protein
MSEVIPPLPQYAFMAWCTGTTLPLGLRAFENKMLRRVFGPKKAEVTGTEKITRVSELDISRYIC